MEIKSIHCNLFDAQADGIVNPWNRNIIPWWLLLPQGVSGELKKRAGYSVFRQVGRFGPIPLGQARLTSAGKLKNKYKGIIHVAGINMLWTASKKSIRDSTQNALVIADKEGWSSLAFPLIGAGSGGMKPDKVLETMIHALLFSEAAIGRVIICLWGRPCENFGVKKLTEFSEKLVSSFSLSS